MKNITTHTRNSSCEAKVVYSRFGKFESLCACRCLCSRGVPIFSNDFRNYSRTSVQQHQQQPHVPLPWSPRTRTYTRRAIFAAGPLDTTTTPPSSNGSYTHRENALDCRGGQVEHESGEILRSTVP